MRVKIDAGGRAVEIECSDANVTAKDVADVALQAWHATDGAEKPSEGPACGFNASFGADPPRITRFSQAPLTVNSEVDR